MNKPKLLSLLGLAMRAGKLVTGEGLTITDIRKNKTNIVFVASNASDNTKKKIKDKCLFYQVPYNDELTQEEISQAIGRLRMVCGVNDPGFAKKMEELIRG